MAAGCLKCCVSCVKAFPVLFIATVVLWSYYAYVVEMCVNMVDNLAKKCIYLILYHLVLFMFLWAYAKTIFTRAAAVPKSFFLESTMASRLEAEESEEVQRQILADAAKNLPVENRTISGCIRYCEKCKCVKPDRAHHCSVCGTCVLKMDHHCPWVNNCVCFNTYKFFILFLFYALVYCLYVAATSLEYFIKFWASSPEGKVSRFHILFLFFVSIMFAISLSALFFYHLYLVAVNKSTLESFRAPIFRTGPDKEGYHIGKMNNFMEVFGDEKRYWLLPVSTFMGDGISYPTRINTTPSYNSMGQNNINNSNNAKLVPESDHVTLSIETPTIDASTPEPPELLPAVDVTLPPPSSSSGGAAAVAVAADHPCLSTARSRERLLPSDDSSTTNNDDSRPTEQL